MNTLTLPLYKGSKHLTVEIVTPPTLRSPDHGEAVPKNEAGEDYGIIRVMTEADGDKRYAWNPRSIPEINEAKDFFNACVKEGLVPYEVGTGGNASSRVMDEFDPHAGEVIFMPVAAVRGG